MQQRVFIEANSQLHIFYVSEILAIKADGNYSVVVLENGDEILVVKQLGAIEAGINVQLYENSPLIRVGRSLIINMGYVAGINPGKEKGLTMRSPGSKVKIALDAPKEALKSLGEHIKNVMTHELKIQSVPEK